MKGKILSTTVAVFRGERVKHLTYTFKQTEDWGLGVGGAESQTASQTSGRS